MHAPPPPPGLCEACRHARVVENRRGSRFYLCGRARLEPDFPRYPRLPVTRCPGFEPSGPSRADGGGDGSRRER